MFRGRVRLVRADSLSGQPVLEAFGSIPSTAPTIVTRFASLGTVNVKASYSAGTIYLDTTDATSRTYVGFTGHNRGPMSTLIAGIPTGVTRVTI